MQEFALQLKNVWKFTSISMWFILWAQSALSSRNSVALLISCLQLSASRANLVYLEALVQSLKNSFCVLSSLLGVKFDDGRLTKGICPEQSELLAFCKPTQTTTKFVLWWNLTNQKKAGHLLSKLNQNQVWKFYKIHWIILVEIKLENPQYLGNIKSLKLNTEYMKYYQ